MKWSPPENSGHRQTTFHICWLNFFLDISLLSTRGLSLLGSPSRHFSRGSALIVHQPKPREIELPPSEGTSHKQNANKFPHCGKRVASKTGSPPNEVGFLLVPIWSSHLYTFSTWRWPTYPCHPTVGTSWYLRGPETAQGRSKFMPKVAGKTGGPLVAQ